MAAEEAIQFEFTATIDSLLSALQESQESMESAFSSMEAKIQEVSDQLDGSLKQASDNAAQSIKNVGEQAKESQDQVSQLGKAMDTAFTIAKITAAYAAVKGFFDEIDRAAEAATHLKNLADLAGATTTEYQGLQATFESAGVPAQMLDRAIMRLNATMAQARDEALGGQMRQRLADVGVTTEDLANKSFGATDALYAIAQSGAAVGDMAAVLGPRTQLLIAAMGGLKDGQAGVEEAARRLGALTSEQIATLHEYHEAIALVGIQWDNYKSALIAEVAPATETLIQSLMKMFGVLNDGGTTTAAFDENIRAIGAELLKWGAAFRELYLQLVHIFSGIGTSIGNLTAVVSAAAQLDFSRAKEIWKEGTADLLQIDADYAKATLKNQNDLADGLYQASLKHASAVHIDQSLGGEARPQTGGGGHGGQDVAQDQRDAEMEKAINEMGVRAIAEFQRQLTADIKQENAERSKVIAETAATNLSDVRDELNQELQAVKENAKLKLISPQEEYAQTIAILEKQRAAEEAYLHERLADSQLTSAQIIAIRREEQKQLDKIIKDEQKAAQDEMTHLQQQWAFMANAIKSSLDSAIKGMLAGTESFGQAMRNIFTSVFDAIINKLLDMVTTWIENLILAAIVNKTTATGQVAANASVAATAAMASVAAIPFYGWALAPEVGASTYLDALSYAAIPSAAGGWEVPQDTLAMVHKDEKILPANISKGLDTLIAGGSSGGTAMHVHLNINAIDTQTGAAFIQSNMKNIATGLQREIQRFNPAVRPR